MCIHKLGKLIYNRHARELATRCGVLTIVIVWQYMFADPQITSTFGPPSTRAAIAMNNHVECATVPRGKVTLLLPHSCAHCWCLVQLHGRIVCTSVFRARYGRLGADIRWHGLRRGTRMRNQAQILAGRPLARAPVRPWRSSPHPAPSRAPDTCQRAYSLIGRASHLQREYPSRGRRCDRHS